CVGSVCIGSVSARQRPCKGLGDHRLAHLVLTAVANCRCETLCNHQASHHVRFAVVQVQLLISSAGCPYEGIGDVTAERGPEAAQSSSHVFIVAWSSLQ